MGTLEVSLPPTEAVKYLQDHLAAKSCFCGIHVGVEALASQLSSVVMRPRALLQGMLLRSATRLRAGTRANLAQV